MINIKMISMLVLAVMSLSMLSTAAAGNVDEKQLNVKVNEKFTIELPDISGSSGYSWNAQFDQSFIRLCDEKIVGDNITEKHTKIYTFKAIKPGKTQIILTQSRPWSNEIPAQTIIYNVNIY